MVDQGAPLHALINGRGEAAYSPDNRRKRRYQAAPRSPRPLAPITKIRGEQVDEIASCSYGYLVPCSIGLCNLSKELRGPKRSQTITYAQHEVYVLSAVLLMPRNASYLYAVVSGGTEIEYGYVVSAMANGKMIHDEVVRGKVGGEYSRCQNTRIQNVFGGVTSEGV